MTEDKSLTLAPKDVPSDGVLITNEKTESLADLTNQQSISQSNAASKFNQNADSMPIKQEVVLTYDECKKDFLPCVTDDGSLTMSTSKDSSCKKPYKCSVCDKRYSTGSNMYTHLKKQHLKVETKVHKCQFCDSAFEKLCRLKDHVRGHMGLAYECVVCNTMLATAASLKRHMKKLHQSAVSYKCNPCNLKFATPSGLEAHDRNHHSGTTLHVCPVCEKSFKTRQGLRKHLSTHPPVDPAAPVAKVVVQEGMEFTITELEADADTVERQKPVKDLADLFDPYSNIAIDQQIIRAEVELISQEDTAINERTPADFEKSIKQENASNMDELEFISDKEESSPPPSPLSAFGKHFMSMDEEDTGSKTGDDDDGAVGFNCTVCKNTGMHSPTLTNIEDVLEHILSHEDVSKNHCTACGKTFTHTSHFKVHISRVHLQSRPHSCPTCLKSFTAPCDLEVHMKRHLGVKPFRCGYCKKPFLARYEVERHIKVRHLETKPKKCIKCAKEFPLASQLRLHIETEHLGLEARKCGTCDMAFGSQFDLDRHEKLHLGISDFKCDSCHKDFSTESHLRRHKRINCNKNRTIDIESNE